MAAVTLTGEPARILTHVARESWLIPPPEEVVTVAERTPRQYLAFRRAWWIVWSLSGGVVVACLGMLTRTGANQPPEAELAAMWFGLFGASLLVAAIAWRIYRATHVATLGPLDAPGRSFRAEPDALVIEAPNAAPRRLAFAAVQQCVVEGHRARHGWTLTALTLDDGAGPVRIEAVWLRRQRVLVALADRLLRAGVVAVGS